jgi:glycosyltransferase involved in cell wall biosynthesis
LRIAVASSGLGHVRRGVETWARDLAYALRRAGQDVTLFQGDGQPAVAWECTLPCLRRFDPATERWVARFARLGGWRYGLGSGYQLEQWSFTRHLWPRIRRDYDILHVQDFEVAWLMERLRRLGLSRPQVILAHGTRETPRDLQRVTHLQHLAPCYLEESRSEQPARQRAYVVPNFVDTDLFRPGNRKAAREAWNLPADHLVVLCVAALKKTHKRIDYLLREFAAFSEWLEQPATLVIAGAREVETPEVLALGQELLGPRVRFLESVSRDRIPSLYQAADVFALASLQEMMPIAVLEALASGLPIACNDTPTLRWMAGPAGILTDISEPGALAAQFTRLARSEARQRLGNRARLHAETTFSEPVVVQQVLALYAQVANSDRDARHSEAESV